nr:MAG TPA: hypothetical protein [Caudoviricetes sp.]
MEFSSLFQCIKICCMVRIVYVIKIFVRIYKGS